MLDWPYVQKRFPWGVAILFGGGFALAGITRFDEKDNKRFRFFPEASKRSGLSVWVGQELGVLGGLPDWAMVVIVCILVLQLKRKILQ